MKKYFFLAFLGAILLAGCGKGEFNPLPVLKLGNGPVLTNPVTTAAFVLTEDKADQVFADFEWTASEYGFDAAVTYTLEMDLAGNDFANPITVGTSNSLSLGTVLNSKINTILLTLGRPGEEPTGVEFRLAAFVNAEVPVVYSQPIQVTVTPYTVLIVYPKLQVPGSYQGWDPANNNTVIFSAKSDNKFEGYVNFPDPNTEFKFTNGPSWDVNYGDTGADGTLDAGGDNIKAADPGMYRLNVNLNNLTYTIAKTDWGLIGSAAPNGWDSDENMTYDAANNKLTITLDLVAGEIKFRANDAWDINLGDDGANKSLEYGGANIAIPEDGNYTVDLILSGAVYTYKITKN